MLFDSLGEIIKNLSLSNKFELWQTVKGFANYQVTEYLKELAETIITYEAQNGEFPLELYPENWVIA